MTVLPFYEIDEAAAVQQPLWLTVPAADRVRRFLCVEGYCINPPCDCKVAHVSVAEAESRSADPSQPAVGAILDLMKKGWRDPKRPIACQFDLATRSLTPGEGNQTAPGYSEILGPLKEALSEEMTARLIERSATAREWGRTRWWQYQDWSILKPGRMVSWVEFYPGDHPYKVEEEGSVYLVEDQYCIVPGCTCNKVFLCFIRVDEKQREDRLIGTLRVSIPVVGTVPKVIGVDEGNEGLLRHLFVKLLNEQSILGETFLLRREIMRLVGENLEKSREEKALILARDSLLGGVDLPSTDLFDPSRGIGNRRGASIEPPRPAGKVHRNDPCPCGSGRKYKKCCGRGGS